MSAIAIIPARGGSRRIPRKNIKDFHGKPIIAYSIEKALESELFDRIVVSTDDKEIAFVSEKYGAEGYMRPKAYGRDEVGTQAVAKECLDFYQYDGDFACVIYATAPLMLPGDLVNGSRILDLRPDPFGLRVPVERFVFPVLMPALEGSSKMQDAGQWYWGRVEGFRESWPLVSMFTRVYPLLPNRVCDINTMEDWSRAEEMYAKLEEMERV